MGKNNKLEKQTDVKNIFKSFSLKFSLIKVYENI